MEQKPLPPLVSARLFDILRSLDGNVAEWVTEDLLSIHDDLVKEEAERSKLMEKITRLEGTTSFETVPKEQYDRTLEVVQAILAKWKTELREDGWENSIQYDNAEALAKSINIEPTKP